MVGPVIFDTVKRYLRYLGYEVTWVVNITDVDDKLIVQAQKEGTTVKELAERVTADYLDCLRALGVDGIDHMPRATEHIAEIIEITQGLIDKGFAYPSAGDVYFDVTQGPRVRQAEPPRPRGAAGRAPGSSRRPRSGTPATSPSGRAPLPIIETYVDGELDGEIAQRVRTHLAVCDSCQEYVAESRQEQEVYALYNREVNITPAMWAAVAARIENEKPVRSRNRVESVGKWLAGMLGTPRLSPALAAALIIATVGTTIVVMKYLNSPAPSEHTQIAATRPAEENKDQQPPPMTTQPPSGKEVDSAPKGEETPGVEVEKKTPERPKVAVKPAAKPAPTPEQLVREAEQKYLSAIAILEKDVTRNKSKLDPTMVVRFEKAMVEIDNTIAETRRAVRENPDDPIALQYMLSAYAKKIDVLREVARSN